MTKMFEVELRYESYTVITVEAENADEAEKIAWDELATDGSYRSDYGNWSLESVEEVKTEGELK
jgi:hypothetical protein